MDRKILIEVTPEEYEKIKNGCLENPLISNFSIEELINEINKRHHTKTTMVEEPWNGRTVEVETAEGFCGRGCVFTLITKKGK